VWKNRENIFHCVEKIALFFHTVETFLPLCGKIPKTFSIVWKKMPFFSTPWKHSFHNRK